MSLLEPTSGELGVFTFPLSFYVEGTAPHYGTTLAQLSYTPMYATGPYSGSPNPACWDWVNIDVIDPEIDLELLDDCAEVSPGGFIAPKRQRQ